MKKNAYILTALFTVMSATAATGIALAHGGPHKDVNKNEARQAGQIRSAVERGELITLSKILDLARAQVPGEVLKVELEKDKGGLKYEVKILTPNGRVREVELDARTGKILKIEDD